MQQANVGRSGAVPVQARADEIQRSSTCRLSGLDRKWRAHGKIDPVDPFRTGVA
jgi:hypothetical protein